MIPNFPTDNLYKFLALGGLALAGFGFWASWQIGDSLRRDEEIARDQAVAVYSDLESLINRLGSTLQGKKNITIKLMIPDTGDPSKYFPGAPGSRFVVVRFGKERTQYRESLTYLDNHVQTYLPHSETVDDPSPKWEGKEQQANELRTKIRLHSLAIENLWHRIDSEYSINWLAYSGGWVGIMISIAGFGCWYYFVQRFQDTLIGLQVERERNDLKHDFDQSNSAGNQ